MPERADIALAVADLLLGREQLTRPEILQQMPIRPAMLFEVIARLVQDGLLLEPQRKGRNTGRRASPIVFNPRYGLFLGIELETTGTTALCIDMQGKAVAHAHAVPGKQWDAAAAKAQVEQVIGSLRDQLGADADLIRAIGFADPGLVDMPGGLSVKAVNIPGWENLPTAQWLTGILGVPAHIIAAPLARTYAEFAAAGSPANKGMFHMQLDEGIGGGFINQGALFTGDGGYAMEIGHVVVQEGGAMCQCGNRGCLEAVAGSRGLERRVKELAQHGVITTLTQRPFSLALLLECVRAGDKAAFALAGDIGHAVAIALSSLICILNPGVVIFSGSTAGLGQPLLDNIRRVLSLRCLPQSIARLELRISELGDDGTALGAALLARKSIAQSAARSGW